MKNGGDGRRGSSPRTQDKSEISGFESVDELVVRWPWPQFGLQTSHLRCDSTTGLVKEGIAAGKSLGENPKQ